MNPEQDYAKYSAETNARLKQVIVDDGIPGFDSYWTTHGRRIRESVGNDRALCDLLRRRLPPYTFGYSLQSCASLRRSRRASFSPLAFRNDPARQTPPDARSLARSCCS